MRVRRVGFGFHLVAILALLSFGWVYASATEFMPYHGAAAGAAWQDLSPGLQVLGVVALRLIGAGSIAVGLALGVILWMPFRRRERWALWTVPVIGVGYGLVLGFAAFSVASATPGNPPWRAALMLPALFLFGGILSLVPVPDEDTSREGGTT